MTKLEFEELQRKSNASGTTLKAFLKSEGIAYSTYNYWNNKVKEDGQQLSIAPIEFRSNGSSPESMPSFSGVDLPGVTLAFPNGVRAHFGRGRKNYLFCGNHEAASNMCVIASLLATCHNHNVNPRAYLTDVIASMPRFEKADQDEISVLLPQRWIEYHPESIMPEVRKLAK